MYNRWSDDEKATLQALYSNASKEEIVKAIPNRKWQTICERAHSYGLHRSYAAKSNAIREGKKKTLKE